MTDHLKDLAKKIACKSSCEEDSMQISFRMFQSVLCLNRLMGVALMRSVVYVVLAEFSVGKYGA